MAGRKSRSMSRCAHLRAVPPTEVTTVPSSIAPGQYLSPRIVNKNSKFSRGKVLKTPDTEKETLGNWDILSSHGLAGLPSGMTHSSGQGFPLPDIPLSAPKPVS